MSLSGGYGLEEIYADAMHIVTPFSPRHRQKPYHRANKEGAPMYQFGVSAAAARDEEAWESQIVTAGFVWIPEESNHNALTSD